MIKVMEGYNYDPDLEGKMYDWISSVLDHEIKYALKNNLIETDEYGDKYINLTEFSFGGDDSDPVIAYFYDYYEGDMEEPIGSALKILKGKNPEYADFRYDYDRHLYI